MSVKNFFYHFVLLYLSFLIPLNAQNSVFKNDSTTFEQRFLSIDNDFKFDFAKTAKQYRAILSTVDSLVKKHPKQTYFLKRKADILNKRALVYIQEAKFTEALEFLTQSIAIRNSYGIPDDASSSYYLMGIVWVRQNEYERAKMYYDSAYIMTERNIKKGKPHQSFKATLLNLYGSHYANLDSISKAEYYFKKAINFADSIGSIGAGAMNRIQYAEVLHDKGRLSEALQLREQALINFRDIGHKEGEMNALSDLAISYNALGNHQKALPLMQDYVDYLKKTNQKGRLMVTYLDYISILEKNRMFEKAFVEQKNLLTLRDSIKNAEKYKELADLDAKLNYESKKSVDSLNIVTERKLIEAEQSKKASVRFWVVVSVLLFVLGIIAFFYFRNRQRIKEQAYQNILLNNKVATKTEEINELLTETIQHIKSKERIAENLQKLSNEQEGITLKSIIADLKASKADNAKLMLIKQNIEQVNFEFIKKLKNLHPELTKTDVEICSLIRIGLSRKEVANLRNTSLEAVKTSRFRIKKKLNLSSSLSLDDYINSL